MTKPFNIPKALIWEAFKKVKENGGAPGVDHESIVKLLYYPYRIRKKLEIIHRLICIGFIMI